MARAPRLNEMLTAEYGSLKSRVAGADSASNAWKYVGALRAAFGVKGLPENLLLVELDSAGGDSPSR